MKKVDYEKALFEAYIGTPAKFEWYQKAFDALSQNKSKLRWYWNSWAMLGGFWYFLYRKQMKIALLLLFVTLVMGTLLPMGVLPYCVAVVLLLSGGFGTSLVYGHYVEKKEEIEAVIFEDEKRISVMRAQVGGVNPWAIPAAIFALVSMGLIVLGLIMMTGRV